MRTRIEREFDPDVVRRLKGGARHDFTVNGPAVVGTGKRFFPDRVRLKLELVDEHFLRYVVRG